LASACFNRTFTSTDIWSKSRIPWPLRGSNYLAEVTKEDGQSNGLPVSFKQ
jgi:hypothetical protein